MSSHERPQHRVCDGSQLGPSSCSCPACPAALPLARWAARGWPCVGSALAPLLAPAPGASGATGRLRGSSTCQTWSRSRGHHRGCSAAPARRPSTGQNVQTAGCLPFCFSISLEALMSFFGFLSPHCFFSAVPRGSRCPRPRHPTAGEPLTPWSSVLAQACSSSPLCSQCRPESRWSRRAECHASSVCEGAPKSTSSKGLLAGSVGLLRCQQ